MALPFLIADVFTDHPFSGNQLAVVLDADDLGTEAMQAIAVEFGFSETTFVLRPEDATAHDARVRIFTPAVELPFAGHPTIGTALALAWRGLVGPGQDRVVLGEGVGPVAVELRRDADGRAVAAEFRAPAPPQAGRGPDPARCAAALGLEPAAIIGAGGLPAVASCGLPFLLVRVAHRSALADARMRDPSLLAGLDAGGVYVFTLEEASGEVCARMFSPQDGIGEDPATGSAAAALAGFLGQRAGGSDGVRRWRIRQGIEMGRPSLIEASATRRGGEVVEVRVGGAAVLVAEGTLAATPPSPPPQPE